MLHLRVSIFKVFVTCVGRRSYLQPYQHKTDNPSKIPKIPDFSQQLHALPKASQHIPQLFFVEFLLVSTIINFHRQQSPLMLKIIIQAVLISPPSLSNLAPENTSLSIYQPVQLPPHREADIRFSTFHGIQESSWPTVNSPIINCILLTLFDLYIISFSIVYKNQLDMTFMEGNFNVLDGIPYEPHRKRCRQP